MKKYLNISLTFLAFLLVQSMNANAAVVAEFAGHPGETQVSIELTEGEASSIDLQITGEEGDSVTRLLAYGGITVSDTCKRDYSAAEGLTCTETITLDSTIVGTKRVRVYTSSGTKSLNLVISRVASEEPIGEENLSTTVSFVGQSGTLDFGQVSGSNQRVLQTVYVKNDSNTNPTGEISNVLVDSSSPFNVISDACTGTALSPRATCRLTLEFTSKSHFNGSYTDQLQVGFEAGVVSLDMAGEIINNEQQFSKLDLELSKQLTPTECLAEAVDASLCYYQASSPQGGQGATSAVSCNSSTNKCFVSTKFTLANEPVEFDIVINFEDQDRPDPSVEADPVNLSYSINPQSTLLSNVNSGEKQTVVITVTNDGTAAIPRPMIFSLKSSTKASVALSDTCRSLTTSLGIGQSCTATVDVTPTSFDAFSVNLDFVSVLGEDTVSITGTVKTAPANTPPPSNYNLVLTKAGDGQGSISDGSGEICGDACSNQTKSYTSGASVTLTATAASGSSFTGWTGACLPAGASTTCALTMDSAKNVGATFTADPVSVAPQLITYTGLEPVIAVSNSMALVRRPTIGDNYFTDFYSQTTLQTTNDMVSFSYSAQADYFAGIDDQGAILKFRSLSENNTSVYPTYSPTGVFSDVKIYGFPFSYTGGPRYWGLRTDGTLSLSVFSQSDGSGSFFDGKYTTTNGWEGIGSSHGTSVMYAYKDDGLGNGTYKLTFPNVAAASVSHPNEYSFCPNNGYAETQISSATDWTPTCFSSGVDVSSITYGGTEGAMAAIRNGAVVTVAATQNGRDWGANVKHSTYGVDCNRDGTPGDTACIESGVIKLEGRVYGFAALKANGDVHVWGQNSSQYYGGEQDVQCVSGISNCLTGNDDVISRESSFVVLLNNGEIRGLIKGYQQSNYTVDNIVAALEPGEKIIDANGHVVRLNLIGDKGTVISLGVNDSQMEVKKDVTYYSPLENRRAVLTVDSSGDIDIVGYEQRSNSNWDEVKEALTGATVKGFFGVLDQFFIELTDGSIVTTGINTKRVGAKMVDDPNVSSLELSADIRSIKPQPNALAAGGGGLYLIVGDVNSGDDFSCSTANSTSSVHVESQDLVPTNYNTVSTGFNRSNLESTVGISTAAMKFKLCVGTSSSNLVGQLGEEFYPEEPASGDPLTFYTTFGDEYKFNPNHPDIDAYVSHSYSSYYYVDASNYNNPDLWMYDYDEQGCIDNGGIYNVFGGSCYDYFSEEVDYYNQYTETQEWIDNNAF